MNLFIQRIWLILSHKSFLWILLFVNLFGTVYGYDWYMWQLEMTEPKFWIFVPDSPTASLFFTLAIIGWLIGRNFKLMEALALITLVKYGLWAVVMNILTLIETGQLGGLAGCLLVHILRWLFKPCCIVRFIDSALVILSIAAIWTLHNDVIDYVFGQMPIYHELDEIYESNWLFYILVINCLYWACLYGFGKKRTTMKSLNSK